MFFPQCMRSIEQYAAIEVLEDNAPASEAQSQLFSLVRKDMEVRKIQGYATARLAGGLLTLKEAGLPVTFNRAVYLATQHLRTAKLQMDKSGMLIGESSIKSSSGVRKAEAVFGAAAHFWLAAEQFPQDFEQLPQGGRQVEFFLEICRFFGNELLATAHYANRGLVKIPQTSLTGAYRGGWRVNQQEVARVLADYNSELR